VHFEEDSNNDDEMKDSYVRSKIVDAQLADVLLVPIEEIQ
jgi:hypothetical protein